MVINLMAVSYTKLEDGIDIGVVQQIPGHENIRTSHIYKHLTNKLLDNFHNPASAFDLEGR